MSDWKAKVQYELLTNDDYAAMTDAVLSIVREALLSPDALEVAADVWNNHHAPTCDRAIQAAWEVAFGADDD